MGRLPLDELILVKLGGSVITDKRRASTPRIEVMARLAREISAAKKERPGLQLVLGHGSGSFGHIVGARYHIQQGIDAGAGIEQWRGYAETAAAAARLNRIVADTLLQAGVPVVSIQPSASARCRAGKLLSLETWAVQRALQHRLVPLLYGDVAFDQAQGCAIISTETVFAYLARQLYPARIVMVGQVAGVFDQDPLRCPHARIIERITPNTIDDIQIKLGGSHGIDVTGGMLTKVRAMLSLVVDGHTQRVHLISGLTEGALRRTLVDAQTVEGTVIEL